MTTTPQAILERVAACYQEIPADCITDRIEVLLGLADAWERLDEPAQASTFADAALTLLDNDLPPFHRKDAINTLLQHTARPADLHAIEADLLAGGDDQQVAAGILDVGASYLRLGFPDDARRCLQHSLTLDPEGSSDTDTAVDIAAALGELEQARKLAASNPERREWRQAHIARQCMTNGRPEQARAIYRKSWQAYQNRHIDLQGCSDQAIEWNLDDCQHLLTLGELALLESALPYVGTFIDVHPIDFWLDLAAAWRQEANPAGQAAAHRIVIAFERALDDMADSYEEARKRVLLAAHQRNGGLWLRARHTLAKARRILPVIKRRNERFYLYRSLYAEYDQQQREEADRLRQQACLWLAETPPPADESRYSHGHCEGTLVADLVKAGWLKEALSLVADAKTSQDLDLRLALADSLCKAGYQLQAILAIDQVEQPYWRIRLYLQWLEKNTPAKA